MSSDDRYLSIAGPPVVRRFSPMAYAGALEFPPIAGINAYGRVANVSSGTGTQKTLVSNYVCEVDSTWPQGRKRPDFVMYEIWEHYGVLGAQVALSGTRVEDMAFYYANSIHQHNQLATYGPWPTLPQSSVGGPTPPPTDPDVLTGQQLIGELANMAEFNSSWAFPAYVQAWTATTGGKPFPLTWVTPHGGVESPSRLNAYSAVQVGRPLGVSWGEGQWVGQYPAYVTPVSDPPAGFAGGPPYLQAEAIGVGASYDEIAKDVPYVAFYDPPQPYPDPVTGQIVTGVTPTNAEFLLFNGRFNRLGDINKIIVRLLWGFYELRSTVELRIWPIEWFYYDQPAPEPPPLGWAIAGEGAPGVRRRRRRAVGGAAEPVTL